MKDVQDKSCKVPMISIIVPVYNVAKWLRECLESIVMQEAGDYEVIMVDDGSTDNSLEIIREYGEKYSSFHVYTKANGGLSSARNYGIDKSKGKYLYFLDSDDKFFDAQCVPFMRQELQNTDIDALYFDGESFFESRELEEQNPHYVTAYQRKESCGAYERGEMLFREFVERQEYYPSACLACYSKDYLQKKGLRFEEGYLYEDNLFTFKCMLLAGKVRHVSRKVLSRRVRLGSITQQHPKWKNVKGYLRAWLQMRKFWAEHAKSPASEAMAMVVDGAKGGVIGTWNMLSDAERRNIRNLPCYERHELESILPRDTNCSGEDYVFPYALMENKSVVAIYGAGKVGTAFYKQAVSGGQVQVAALVDANAASMANNGLPVQPVFALKDTLFDLVLIAIEREDVAQKVRQNLLEMGIPDGKIRWYGDYYRWNPAYSQMISPLMKYMKQMASSQDRRFWLFMLPEHGNMGDYAIGYAAETFLHRYFPDTARVDVTEGEWYRLSEQIKSLVHEKDILFLNGGGDFGDLWTTGKIQRSIVEMFPNNKIIFLPNTLTYQGEISEENGSLMQDMAYYGRRKNVHLIFRERNSYEFCARHLENVYCYPDLVLSRVVPRSVSGAKRKALLCFRSDKESIFEGKAEIKEILEKNGWTYEEMDIHQMRYVSQEDGKEILEEITRQLQSVEVVITDRLHGMVLSATGQVPCIAFDNSTRKISGVYSWFKDCPNVKMGDEEKLADLMDWIREVTAIPCCFKPFDKEFSAMAERIKTIIG